MKASISDKYYLSDLTSQDSAAIKEKLTFPNPKYSEAIRQGYSTWNIPARLELFEQTDQGLAIPRGTDLIGLVTCRIEDQRHSHPVEIKTSIALRDYQQRAVD